METCISGWNGGGLWQMGSVGLNSRHLQRFTSCLSAVTLFQCHLPQQRGKREQMLIRVVSLPTLALGLGGLRHQVPALATAGAGAVTPGSEVEGVCSHHC